MLLNPDQARRLFLHAVEQRYAILAVNADSPAAIHDVLMTAAELDAPVIIETSLWQLQGHSFGAGDPLLGIERYVATVAGLANHAHFDAVPVILHTDHIKGPQTFEILRHAMTGVVPAYSSISVDSSEMSEAENIEALCRLCRYAEEAGCDVSLEMEAGVDDGLTPLETASQLLRPVEEAHPGRLTLWAPGVGTQHGLKEGGYPTFDEAHVRSHAERAATITGRPMGIALHGSSGLPEEALRRAVEAGVAKVNWSSESLLIRSTAAQDYYQSHEAELQKGHPQWKTTAMDNGVQTFISERYRPKVAERIRLLGGNHQAGPFLRSLQPEINMQTS